MGRASPLAADSDFVSFHNAFKTNSELFCTPLMREVVSPKFNPMKTFIKIFAIPALVFINSCSYEEMADKLVPQKESEFAQEYLQKLQSKEFDYVKKYIDPSIENQVTDKKLQDIANHFPEGDLISTELIGSQVNQFNSRWQGNFSFEYQFANGWAVANAVVKKSNDELTVVGFNVYQTEASQKELNKFTLAGKSLLQYVVLVMAMAALLFTLVTIYFCIRTPIPRRKWLWVFFILIGIGSISVNWTTGQWNFQILNFRLFSAGIISSGPFSPWTISASIPVGAILFWIKRKKFSEESNSNISSESI